MKRKYDRPALPNYDVDHRVGRFYCPLCGCPLDLSGCTVMWKGGEIANNSFRGFKIECHYHRNECPVPEQYFVTVRGTMAL